MSQNQKDQWKKDADQLKRDLNNREKEVVKREVPIKVRNPKKNKSTAPTNNVATGKTEYDSFLRQSMGL